MPENLAFDDFDFLIPDAPAILQNDPNIELPEQTKIKRLRISELIADNDELVRQLKQLQDFQRTANEVSELYQSEKQKRLDLECRTQELNGRCNELEKQLDVQQLNCEQLQEELDTKRLPVDAKHMATLFIQLAQRVGDNTNASGLLRREVCMLNKLRDFCKSSNISIPTWKSPTKKPTKLTTTAIQASHATQTNEPVSNQPVMCSTGVQYENLLTTKDQGTQHKNMTTTRGTTTASFIKKHDVGTCFPEPKPALTAQQILNKMLAWNTVTTPITPLSSVNDAEPEPEVQLQSVGTCTDLCNINREIDFLPELPTVLKCSNSRPPSRAMCDSVKDELTLPTGYGQHMAKELFNFLPHNQSVLTNLPPHVFEEVWQVMGQMVLVVLQRRSANPAMSSNINQADFSSWFDAIYQSSHSVNTKECEVSTPVERTASMDADTDPMMTPKRGVELTPIRLPRKPVSKKRTKRKARKRRAHSKPEQCTETAVHFLSNLNAFINPNCDNLNIQLDEEEQQFLQLTSAVVCTQQLPTPAASCKKQTEIPPEQQFIQLTSAAVCSEQLLNPSDSCKQQTEITPKQQFLQLTSAAVCTEQLPTPAASCKQQTEITPEQQFLHLTSAAVCTEQLPTTVASCKQQTEITPEQVHSNNLLLETDAKTNVEPAPKVPDKPNCQQSHIVEAAPKVPDKPNCQESHIEMQDPYYSDDSCKLVIDVEETVDLKSSAESELAPSTFTLPRTVEILPAVPPLGKRKRKTSKCDDDLPVTKRLTRLQVKQLKLMDTEASAVKESNELNKEIHEFQSNCIDFSSPASPVNEQQCDDSEIIEIPLESPGVKCSSNMQQTALISHVVSGIKMELKQRRWRKQQPCAKQLEQLEQKVVNYLKSCMLLSPAIRKFFTAQNNYLVNALIKAFEELELSDEHLERLFTLLNLFESSAFTERFMCSLEQRLFPVKERPDQKLARKFIKLYLELVKHQAGLARTADSYINPTRLLLAKILYHYSKDMTVLVMEVLNYYPTVLPHREERAYDNSDALITVIKHLLMCHKYEVEDPQGVDRALISQLRFVYHFKPFEPTKQQVVDNLVEKLKAGHLENLSCALALFCRRSESVQLVQALLQVQLLPLLDSYCDLCIQNEEYDERMECLLQCVSMIVKQLPLDQTKDISVYIAIFKRVLVVVPRSIVQQAAVQAILRTQRFGFNFVLDALKSYRPNYELTAMTRAMLRSFAVRRQKFRLPH